MLLQLLRACAERVPEPLYPSQYVKEQNLDRDIVDRGLDELRRRGLIRLTDWVKDRGQGRALTDAGTTALTTRDLAAAPPEPVIDEQRYTHYERGEEVRRAMLERRPVYASWVLLAVILIFFVGGAILAAFMHDGAVADYLKLGDTLVLHRLGALWPPITIPDPAIFEGRPELERLLLFAFLHAGILHLALNAYFLGSLGRDIESIWGSWRFLVIYFIAGLVSGCVVVAINYLQYPDWREIPVTVGASGPLYGVFASLVVWFALNWEHLPDNFAADYSRQLTGMAVVLLIGNFWPHVSWQGHLGGAIGGALAALLLNLHRFHPHRGVRWLALLRLPAIPGGFFLLAAWIAGWF